MYLLEYYYKDVKESQKVDNLETNINYMRKNKENYSFIKAYEIKEIDCKSVHECSKIIKHFKIETKFYQWVLINEETSGFHTIKYCPFCGEKL